MIEFGDDRWFLNLGAMHHFTNNRSATHRFHLGRNAPFYVFDI